LITVRESLMPIPALAIEDPVAGSNPLQNVVGIREDQGHGDSGT
jgi:hypothetical protein